MSNKQAKENKFIKGNKLKGISLNVRKAKDVQISKIEENYRFDFIERSKIDRNEKNFYRIEDIEELAEDIAQNGLSHNLVIRDMQNGRYELLSGERRYHAMTYLAEKVGLTQYDKMPCKIVTVNDLDAEIVLIQANAQGRELSDKEILKQVERLTDLYKQKKENGEQIPGRVRDLIAKNLDLSRTQVGRYERINKKLIPKLKEALEEGRLQFVNASEFASLSEENQEIIAQIVEQNEQLTTQQGAEIKATIKNITEEKETSLAKVKEAFEETEQIPSAISLEDVVEQVETQHQERIEELKNTYKPTKTVAEIYTKQVKTLNKQVTKGLEQFEDWSGDVQPPEKMLLELYGKLQCLLDKVEVMLEDCNNSVKEEMVK